MMTAADTDTDSANGQPVKPPKLSKEQMAKLTREMFSSFGQITTVLMRSAEHRHAFLAELEWLVVPAILSSQYSISSAVQNNTGLAAPQAVVMWAHVSDLVDKRLAAGGGKPRLRPHEWTSGQIPWLIDVVGDTKSASSLLKTIVEKRFAKTGLKTMHRAADGKYSLQVLRVAAVPAAKPAAEPEA